MARRTFFSFHYQRDVQRSQVVRKSWLTKPNREEAGYFDGSVFESKQRTSDDALKRFLNDGLDGSSVTCVLAGNQTAHRRWVRYELLRSFVEGKGILCVNVHSIQNFAKETDVAGPNPLAHLGFEIKDFTLKFKELNGAKWEWAKDIASMPVRDVAYDLSGTTNATFERLFQTFDWNAHGGYNNLGDWVEAAAKKAGR